jgi:hypothetical protein
MGMTMLELFETESGTVLATYGSLDDALDDIREEIRVGGRTVAQTWALGERQQDGRVTCVVQGDSLIDRAQNHAVRAAS